MEFNKQSFFVHHVEWFELYNPWLSAPNWSLSDQTYDKLYRFPCGECARQLQTRGRRLQPGQILYDILFTMTVFSSFISSLASCIWRSFFFLRISPFFTCLRIPPIQSTGSIIFCTKIRITTLATYRMKIITLRSTLF